MEHPVFGSRLTSGQSRCLIHSGRVALNESDVVPKQQELRRFSFAFSSYPDSFLSFRHAIEKKIREGDVDIPGTQIRIDPERDIGFFDRLFILAGALESKSRKQSMSIPITGV